MYYYELFTFENKILTVKQLSTWDFLCYCTGYLEFPTRIEELSIGT